MNIPSELGHLTVPTNSLAQWKNKMATRVSNPGLIVPESYALPWRFSEIQDARENRLT